MNRLTSKQRKMSYLAGIVVLLIPIIWLGRPDEGGRLSQLRQVHDLGESTLGNVDPTSATMNLVLLGLRGVATNLLWMEHDEQKRTKNWAQMRATTDSIIMLQPHYLQVWRYHGWDLAYNVSAEWDGVEDRYWWVKEGAKFTMKGSIRNTKYAELYWETGRILGQKVGRADEWRFFRKFFKSDPYEEFNGGPDPAINPNGDDNYITAKGWYAQANEVEVENGQHIMMRELFRSYPARSQLDYAVALQREGVFDEVARIAWQDGYNDWTQGFGKMIFQKPGCAIYLEADADDVREMAKTNNVEESLIRKWLTSNQNVTNYRYWRMRAIAESEKETVTAHRLLYSGEQYFRTGELDKAFVDLSEGMRLFEAMLRRNPGLLIDDLMAEEGLWAVMLWKKTHQLKGQPEPPNYPLKRLWDAEQRRMPNLNDRFNRRFGGL